VDLDVDLVAEVVQRHMDCPMQHVIPIPTYTDTLVCAVQLPDASVIFKAADPDGRDPSARPYLQQAGRYLRALHSVRLSGFAGPSRMTWSSCRDDPQAVHWPVVRM